MSVVRPQIKSIAVLACLATLAVCYFSNTPIPSFLTRLKDVLLAAVILLSAAGVGHAVLQILPLPFLSSLEKLIFSVALGLGLLSTAMVGLGVFHAWTPVGAWLLLAAGGIKLPDVVQTLRKLFSFNTDPAGFSKDEFASLLALILGGGLSFLLAFAPVVYYDSLVYHFALPTAYIQVGHWTPLRGLIYSAFPQTLEMLWTLCLLIGSDTIANIVAWSLAGMLITAVFSFARRFIDTSVGWVAAALLALMPAVLLLSSGGYVDVGLTLFSFLAFYAICLNNGEKPWGSWLCAGLFAGYAVSTKYTGGLSVVLVAGCLIVRYWKLQKMEILRGLAVYGVAAFMVWSPWLIKNLLYVGNPVFPFFYTWGIKSLNPWINQAAAGYFAGITEYYSRSLWELPRVLWEAAVNGIGFGRGIDVLGDFGWIPMFALLPALWLCRKLSVTVKLLLAFAALFFIAWAVNRPVLRFLLPLSPILSLLAAYAWVNGIRPQAAGVRWGSRLILGSFILSGLFLFFYATNTLASFPVAMGLEDRESYLRRMLNYYPAAEFINTQTPPESHVYVMGDQRGYYYQRPIWVSPVFSKNPLIEWANAAQSPKQLQQTLRDNGVTHLLVNRAEFERLKVYRFSELTEHGKSVWEKLRAGLKLLYRDPACDVFAI